MNADMVYYHWTLEIKFIEYLIIRLTNYNVTISLLYQNLIGDTQGFQCTAISGGFSDKTLKETKWRNSAIKDWVQ